jgi:uncharacterized protein YjiS (DUF1127 family)
MANVNRFRFSDGRRGTILGPEAPWRRAAMSNSTTTCGITFPSAAAPHPRATAAGGWLGFLARMVEAIETCRMLAGLDDRMLADIGLSRADALREAERKPWYVAAPGGEGRPRQGAGPGGGA